MDELEGIQISGTVIAVIYKNEENGYTVLKFREDGGKDDFTVVGTLSYTFPGDQLIISGSWGNHSVHGKQFNAEFTQRILPSTVPAIYDYLAGGAIKGVGPATASLIVNKFGAKTLEIIENTPERLTEIKGISASKAEKISEEYQRQNSIRKLIEFVNSFGVRPILALRMYKFYGDEAMSILHENPYILATGHIGGSFSEADLIALEIGFESNSKNRICAAALFELTYNLRNGHCFIPREKLCAVTAELVGVDYEAVDECIDILEENSQIFIQNIAKCNACYLPYMFEAEANTASKITQLTQRKSDIHCNIDSLIRKQEAELGIEYAPMQKKILDMALNNMLLVITGGPGTGKTTSINAILSLYESQGIKTLLTAPTGRAAKRMSEVTGYDASTIHRLLGAKFADDEETVIFDKNEENQLECGAVILDECSMVDINLMSALLNAMPEEARLVLVGDADQLPSVGPGNVFSSIIRSQVVPTIKLTEIFRQKDGSKIIRNAHAINRGEHPDFSENSGDFFMLKRNRPEVSVDTITDLFKRRLPENMKIKTEDIQILSPTRKGEMGTINLNKRLQELVNPKTAGKKEKLFGEKTFRVDDRVMQIKNNYDIMWTSENGKNAGIGIFNGDLGVIAEINHEAETMTVNFDGKLAVYSFESLNELEHAWAVTVHKSQGSEYKAVILSLSESSQLLMTRDVLYTAISRAKQLLIMVGDDNVAYKMIDNYKKTNRYNALRLRLRMLAGVE